MKRPDVSRALTWARRKTWPLRSKVGHAGVLGVGLLILGAGLAAMQGLLHSRSAQALAALEHESAGLSTLARRMPAQGPSRAEESLRALPSADTHLRDLRALFDLAAHHRLGLDRSDLQPGPVHSTGMSAVVVTLPLQGSYANLKGFAGDALKGLPHLALQDLRMERPDIGSSEIKARVRVALYYRGGQP